jgi:hypothetical protein
MGNGYIERGFSAGELGFDRVLPALKLGSGNQFMNIIAAHLMPKFTRNMRLYASLRVL